MLLFWWASLLGAGSASVWAAETYLARPFGIAASRGLSPGRLAISFEVGGINDTLDVLNMRGRELKKVVPEARTETLGDSSLARLVLGYGLSENLSFFARAAVHSLDYGYRNLRLVDYAFSLRRSLGKGFSLELGFRKHQAEDQVLRRPEEINWYLHRFRPDISMQISPDYIGFIKKTAQWVLKVRFPRTETPSFELQHMGDRSLWGRLTFGYPFSFWYPNFFLEYGKTRIWTEISSNLRELLPEKSRNLLPALSLDLGRSETYVCAGFSLLAYLPGEIFVSLQYSYYRFFRESSLDYLPYNHRLQFRLYHPLWGPFWIFLGGVYLHRQLNGEIPFLYNRYTQTSFDHRYGWIECGLSFSWP